MGEEGSFGVVWPPLGEVCGIRERCSLNCWSGGRIMGGGGGSEMPFQKIPNLERMELTIVTASNSNAKIARKNGRTLGR
jgi:hypothetical protein